jgi:hypothetical protein
LYSTQLLQTTGLVNKIITFVILNHKKTILKLNILGNQTGLTQATRFEKIGRNLSTYEPNQSKCPSSMGGTFCQTGRESFKTFTHPPRLKTILSLNSP